LAADPTRAARFTEAEPQLRALFTPGEYVERVRAELLGVPSRRTL